MQFTYIKKSTTINRDPKIKRAIKDTRRRLRVREVKDLRDERGNKFAGASDYKRREIILEKTLTPHQKYTTALHEIAHNKIKQEKVTFGKRVRKELKKMRVYRILKKDGYTEKKIPEEAFAEYYTSIKAGLNKKKLKEIQKKYPTVAKKFNEIVKR